MKTNERNYLDLLDPGSDLELGMLVGSINMSHNIISRDEPFDILVQVIIKIMQSLFSAPIRTI